MHENIPVTENLLSTFTLTDIASLGTIEIDTNGDGTNDTILESNTQTPKQIVQELNTYIKSLDVHYFVKESLLWRAKVIERLIEQDWVWLVEQQFKSFERIVKVYARFRLLSDEEQDTIRRYLDELRKALTR